MSLMMIEDSAAATAIVVERALQGDDEAIAVLARRACRMGLRTASAMLRSREEASDIGQDVAVDVLRSLPTLRDPDAFDAWVHRITVRRTLRVIRRKRVRSNSESSSFEDDRCESPADVTDLATRLALRGVLTLALGELPPKQRIALALRYVHDASDAEIAAALHCRPGTVHALLSRGRAALRDDARLAEFAPNIAGDNHEPHA